MYVNIFEICVENCRLILHVATPWDGGRERNIPTTAWFIFRVYQDEILQAEPSLPRIIRWNNLNCYQAYQTINLCVEPYILYPNYGVAQVMCIIVSMDNYCGSKSFISIGALTIYPYLVIVLSLFPGLKGSEWNVTKNQPTWTSRRPGKCRA